MVNKTDLTCLNTIWSINLLFAKFDLFFEFLNLD